jgi:hypothetical protein
MELEQLKEENEAKSNRERLQVWAKSKWYKK